MIRVIMGKKGSGKTKNVIEMINSAVQTEHGSVVCIEKGNKLTFDIHYHIRLVEASDYDIANYTALKGFISGLYAGNYDISHVFIDNLCKVAKSKDDREVGAFLTWLDGFSSPLNIKFTITISADPDTATDTMRKFM